MAHDLTRLLERANGGDDAARSSILEKMQLALKEVARRRLQGLPLT